MPEATAGTRTVERALTLLTAVAEGGGTLTDEEVTAARDAAVAEAGRRVGAVLRGTS